MKRPARWPYGLALLVAAISLWQALSCTGVVAPARLPSPISVGEAFWELGWQGLPPGYTLAGHLAGSLARIGWGFILAAPIAIILGFTMGYFPVIRALANPIIEILRPIPPLAWVPLSILWFGIGNPSAVFIIGLGAFFPVLLNTVAGVEASDPRLADAAYTMGASKWQVMVKVIFPQALPSLFTGLRVGLDIAWMTLVAAEYTGIKSGYGLGYMIMLARDLQRPDAIVAGMLVIGAIGYLMDWAANLLITYCLRWK